MQMTSRTRTIEWEREIFCYILYLYIYSMYVREGVLIKIFPTLLFGHHHRLKGGGAAYKNIIIMQMKDESERKGVGILLYSVCVCRVCVNTLDGLCAASCHVRRRICKCISSEERRESEPLFSHRSSSLLCPFPSARRCVELFSHGTSTAPTRTWWYETDLHVWTREKKMLYVHHNGHHIFLILLLLLFV